MRDGEGKDRRGETNSKILVYFLHRRAEDGGGVDARGVEEDDFDG